jgi:hypothetical protein
MIEAICVFLFTQVILPQSVLLFPQGNIKMNNYYDGCLGSMLVAAVWLSLAQQFVCFHSHGCRPFPIAEELFNACNSLQ